LNLNGPAADGAMKPSEHPKAVIVFDLGGVLYDFQGG
jgi:hypothetical protein